MSDDELQRAIWNAKDQLNKLKHEIAHLKTLHYSYVPKAIAKCEAKIEIRNAELDHHNHILALLQAAVSDRIFQSDSFQPRYVKDLFALQQHYDMSISHTRLGEENCNNNNKRKETER